MECVFDGLEWVKERCTEWLVERMSEKKAWEMLRADERHGHDGENGHPPEDTESGNSRVAHTVPDVPAEMPPGITIVETEPILDRKSAFVGRACRITDPSQVRLQSVSLLALHVAARTSADDVARRSPWSSRTSCRIARSPGLPIPSSTHGDVVSETSCIKARISS